ncbi:MAG: tyrosine-type recombinase/integrase [Vibrio sp.]
MNKATGVENHNGKLRIWFMYKGKREREPLGLDDTPKNRKLAAQKRASVCYAIKFGNFIYSEWFPNSKKSQKEIESKELTIEQLFEKWIEIKSFEITPATINNYKNRFIQVFQFWNKDTPVKELKQQDLLEIRSYFLTTCTAGTTNTYMRTIKGAIGFAANNGYCDESILRGVKELKLDKKKPKPFTRDEFKTFISACRHQQDINFWTVAVFTGMRHGELASLAWEDIDLEKGTITVNRNITLKGLFKLPKTKAGERVINLLEPAKKALLNQFELTGHYPSAKIEKHLRSYGSSVKENIRPVFTPKLTARHHGHMTDFYFFSSINEKFKLCCARSGVADRNPYQTRHTYACWMLSAGANPTFIAKQMGHSSAKEVYNTYGDWVGDFTQGQVDLLNQIYN